MHTFDVCVLQCGKGKKKRKKGRRREEDGPRSSIARIAQKGEVAKRYAARNSFLDKVAAGWL